MKTREVVTIALGVFALAYFVEWMVEKASPEQCWITETVSEDVQSSKWEDCPSEGVE
ncbi:TMhelix containing protein [Vibrio phage 1.250.O._10N.261.55.E11]|nr:TMhelix containing protein [Vibrio phage 1.250.O._10N.261.55.E11]